MSAPLTRHWISCGIFTVQVETTQLGLIVEAAPIVKRFKGQPLSKLLAWAQRFGQYRHEVLGPA